MKRVVSLFWLTLVLVTSASLALQWTFATYFCDENGQQLIAGQAITVCGVTCPLTFEEPEVEFDYDLNAPPFFQEHVGGYTFQCLRMVRIRSLEISDETDGFYPATLDPPESV